LEFSIEEFPGYEERTEEFKPRSPSEEFSFGLPPDGGGEANERYAAIMAIAVIAIIEAGSLHDFIS
jgi:hypothetical protein